MKRGITFIAVPVVVLGSIFALGPKASFPDFDPAIAPIAMSLEDLDAFIAAKESEVANLKPNNQSRIIWADSIRQTDFAVVYLHGFSASGMEGDPVHINFAKKFGWNLYIPRLAGHGIEDEDAFAGLTPQDLIDSAKEAIAIGQLLGKKVIVMSTSTGGTLSIYLAATNPEAIFAQILYSPNIDLYSQAADILTYPWGLHIGQMVEGERRYLHDVEGEARNYWTMTYRLEGVVTLKYLMEHTMKPEIFRKIKQPLFLGYYYKNEEEQDHIVSVEAMQQFFNEAGTSNDNKIKRAFPEANHHVICSRFRSKAVDEVTSETIRFAEEILGM